jgi:hypothetical protein
MTRTLATRTLAFIVAFCALACVAQTQITIHVKTAAAQRAIDEGELMSLLKQDFTNMDEHHGATVDMAVRRRMDVLMKRLMTQRMWAEQ